MGVVNLPFFVLLVGAGGLFLVARRLSERRRELLAFLQQPEVRLESFDEITFGVTAARLPEATSWVVLAVACALLGGLGAVTLGLASIVLIRTAPLVVLPTLLFLRAAWVGWQSLRSQVGRIPVVRRLRLTQAHLVLDEARVGLGFEPEELGSAAGGRARAIFWEAVTRVDRDDHDSLVLGVRGEADAVFGPLSPEVASELIRLIERRRAVRSEGGEVIDLARVRLRALTERVDRSDRDPPRDPDA